MINQTLNGILIPCYKLHLVDIFLVGRFNQQDLFDFHGGICILQDVWSSCYRKTGKGMTVLPEQYQKLKQKNWQGKKCVPLLGYLKLD